MLRRKELKLKGKEAFKRNYWACVVAALVLTFMTNSLSSFEFKTNISYENGFEHVERYLTFSDIPLMPVTLFQIACALIVSVLVSILIASVLEVGGCAFFSKNSYEPADFKEVFFGFDKRWYKNIVTVQFFCNLKIFLWGLLFVIPGIIKSYEYYMVPYILSENPYMEHEEALRKSKEMMNGYKMEVFIFELSFILWNLLAAMTFGLLALFYVTPYTLASRAEIYHELKPKEFANNENMNESSQ